MEQCVAHIVHKRHFPKMHFQSAPFLGCSAETTGPSSEDYLHLNWGCPKDLKLPASKGICAGGTAHRGMIRGGWPCSREMPPEGSARAAHQLDIPLPGASQPKLEPARDSLGKILCGGGLILGKCFITL